MDKTRQPGVRGSNMPKEEKVIFSDEVKVDLSPEEKEAYLEIIREIRELKPDKKGVERIKRNIGKKYKLKRYPRNSDILRVVPEEWYKELLPYLRIRNVRSLSGVNVISVFTAPFSCPHGTCIFCPGGPSWGTPQSYTGREPGAMRAIANGYDPEAQIVSRIEQLNATGHNAEKLDIIIMGGTFNSTPTKYQEQFVMGIYRGLNRIDAQNIEEAKKLNETAKYRCIGLTIETKPDWALKKHIIRMLEYGTTRVELGVQTLQEEVLKFTRRGHTLEDTVKSFKALRDAGLKITAHMMPGLPGNSIEQDIEDFRILYTDSRFIPDEIKIYPTQVIENTELAQMAVRGEYTALTNEQTFHIIREAKLLTPPFVRIKRALRDLPAPLIIDGPTWGDMRAKILDDLKKYENIKCRCIRCREVGLHLYLNNKTMDDLGEFKPVKREYEASDGMEYFLSYEDDNELLIGFLRLRFPSPDIFLPVLENAAIVRELHVYGSSLPLQDEEDGELAFQHRGYGRKLIKWAEQMSKEAGYKKLAIISGVGVREYYRKLGYQLEDYYMVKYL